MKCSMVGGVWLWGGKDMERSSSRRTNALAEKACAEKYAWYSTVSVCVVYHSKYAGGYPCNWARYDFLSITNGRLQTGTERRKMPYRIINWRRRLIRRDELI